MLRIPTYVAPSGIAGMGLFTGVDLEPGTIIWEYTEGIDWQISPEELEDFPEPYRSHLFHHAYLDESGSYVLCGDNARFMNHADDPNCDDSGEVHTVVRRPVRAGEELTCDYRLFDVEARREGLFFELEAQGRSR